MADSPQNSYFICIRNRSGVTSNYAVLVAPPLIQPSPDPVDVSTPIVSAFRNVPSGNGTILFEVPKQIHAVCGTAVYDEFGSPPVLEIFDQKPVICAQPCSNGSVEPGSSLRMTSENSQPAFIEDGIHSAKPNAFSVKTSADFTTAEARQKGYFVGICGPFQSTSSRRNFGFYSTFVPKPNISYSLQPRPIVGILLGNFQPRSKFIGAVDDILEVDFAKIGSEDVEIIHTERNKLVIVRNPVMYNEATL